MIDRRTLLAGGAMLGMTGLGRATSKANAKQLAIHGIVLPGAFNGVLAYGKGAVSSTCAARESRHRGGSPRHCCDTV